MSKTLSDGTEIAYSRDYVLTTRDQIEIALSAAATQARLGFSDSAWDSFCKCASEAIQQRLKGKFMDDEKDLDQDFGLPRITQTYLLREIAKELRALRRLTEARETGKAAPKPREGAFSNAK
jgi:hypothetical protein